MQRDFRGYRGVQLVAFPAALALVGLLAGEASSSEARPFVVGFGVSISSATGMPSPSAEVSTQTVDALRTGEESLQPFPGPVNVAQARSGDNGAGLIFAAAETRDANPSVEPAPAIEGSGTAQVPPVASVEEELDDLDAAEIAGMKMDKKAVKYLGKRAFRRAAPVLKTNSEEVVRSGTGTIYDNSIILRGKDLFFRLQDKRRNVVLDWKIQDPRDLPYQISHQGLFVTHSKTVGEDPERRQRYGLRVFDLQGKPVLEIPPETTGQVWRVGTNNHGVFFLDGFEGKKFLGFDQKGNKLWEIEPGVSDYFFSEDGRYFTTRTRILEDEKTGKMMDEASLYDIRGNKLVSFRDIPEIAPRFKAISTDSKYAAYLRRDTKDGPSKLYLMDMKDFTVKRTYPISSYPVAISKEARYVAALDMSYDKAERMYVKTLKVYDDKVNLLAELELERRSYILGDPRDKVTFTNNDSLVQVKYKDETYYFSLLSKE